MSTVMAMPDEGRSAPDGKVQKWVLIAVLVALLGGAGWWIAGKIAEPASAGPKRQTVKIAVLPDTPPPPPPPKPDKPPEPEKQEVKPQVQQEQPKPQEAPPAPAQLKMDGPAGDGPSAFAAGQVSTEYKGGEIGTGSGGGVNKLQFALFTNKMTRHIQLALSKDKDVKFDFRVNVQVWLDANGAFQKVLLASSTGDEHMDAALRSALTKLPPVDNVPGNLPQPLLLRITNRLTG
ncbi:MAG: TonB C-terminal domain-containing protein [Acidobacteriota bacterium]